MGGRTESVLIVGAGLGGLSAALRLAGAGREVTVIERAAGPGGRAGRLELDGYSFDTGPTVLTMPELIADALACVGENMTDWLDLIPLDPAYRATFADGSVIDVHTDIDAMSQEIAQTCSARDVQGYRRFVTYLRRLYDLERRRFIDQNLDSPLALVNVDAARLFAMGGLRRLSPKVAQFLKDERLQRIFSFQAMYAGLAPQDALAIYAVIAYMDTVTGVTFPRGGMHKVPLALAGAAAKHGVTFRYGTTAQTIEVTNDRASAVITTDGERLTADVIVVNADLPVAYRDLLPERHTPRRVRSLTYSPSCFLMHVGAPSAASSSSPDLAHHNISFGHEWRRTFREIIKDGRLMSDPSFLISNPTRTDPGLAPEGKQTYYVLFPTPNLTFDLDWSVLGPRYRDEVLATLDARGYTGISGDIEVERYVTPADWGASGLAAGAPFAAAHTFRQSGPLRTPTLDRRIDNLVFCGSNTQPGVGVPMVLLSGRLAAERITGVQA
ncbi:phytoene desaturase family protein [Jatrophihabitans telluris]|uniref:Phytoene desaturase family protein n=1 Tax=Jatrophihabitans telluris TaxID=2038343 RepID=A0ABY4QT27_9ACTN|nr:phytoene desaturase family protein [Jatrophihabitans telluris]UQX86855.1 phytoene desaturase family protein [Jatrophihabitans telluris]